MLQHVFFFNTNALSHCPFPNSIILEKWLGFSVPKIFYLWNGDMILFPEEQWLNYFLMIIKSSHFRRNCESGNVGPSISSFPKLHWNNRKGNFFKRKKPKEKVRVSTKGDKTTATKFGNWKAVNDLENLRNLNPKLEAGRAENQNDLCSSTWKA